MAPQFGGPREKRHSFEAGGRREYGQGKTEEKRKTGGNTRHAQHGLEGGEPQKEKGAIMTIQKKKSVGLDLEVGGHSDRKEGREFVFETRQKRRLHLHKWPKEKPLGKRRSEGGSLQGIHRGEGEYFPRGRTRNGKRENKTQGYFLAWRARK